MIINTLKKFTLIFLIFFFIFSLVPTNCFALDADGVDWVFETDENEKENEGITKAKNVSNNIITNFIMVIKILGVGVALIMLVLLGVKYMTGSLEERAEIKKHAVIYFVGAVMFFGAFGILSLIQDAISGTFRIGN